MVRKIEVHRIRISISPRPGDSSPKKATFHRRLSASCTKNSAIAAFAPEKPFSRHTSRPETAIERYRTVHTGPNNQPGGVKNGLSRGPYQTPPAGSGGWEGTPPP